MKRMLNKETYDYDIARSSILSSPRFNKYEFKSSQIPAEIKKKIISYMENIEENFKEGIGLYLYSNTPGSGKTTIMAIVLKDLMQRGYRVYCDSLIETKTKLKKEFDTDQRILLNTMKDIEILAIDDIGSEVMSNWLDETFKELLDHRYNLQKPTIFTSNVLIEHLPFSLKSKDRLKEISIVLKFPEKSLRKALDI